MQIEESYIESEVYSTLKAKSGDDIYLVKVSFVDVGCYINSITVRKSLRFPDKGWWVQPPKYPPKWKQHIEFSNDSALWKLIEEFALKAVESYLASDWVPTEEELNNPERGLDEAIKKMDEPP